MLDHIGLSAGDFERSKGFYTHALAPLGIALLVELSAEQTGGDAHAGFGANGGPFLWLGSGEHAGKSIHIAFTAASRSAVDAFYQAALAAGGKDNGPPGLRPYYHPDYYGAFVLDPDGNNIEAVCRTPE